MVFKSLYFNIIGRTILLTAAASVFAFCLMQGLYLRGFYSGLALLLITLELIRYINRFNRDINSFLLSLLQRDFTTRFNAMGKSKSYQELYTSLNQITQLFKTISTEKEIQHQYLELLVNHIDVGIISYDENEQIHIANKAIKTLLQKENLRQLKNLDNTDSNLSDTIRNLSSGQTRLVKMQAGNALLQLSVHASEFRLQGTYYKLISLQNIRSELEAREMEAWQKLISVLTHEIMNSVSPIMSLSDTLHQMIGRHKEEQQPLSDQALHNLDQGLLAIKIRSEGLQSFTEAYRRLTRIPAPKFTKITAGQLLLPIQALFQSEMHTKGIQFSVFMTDENITVTIDKELMAQVIVNLIRNAIDAVTEVAHPHIQMSATTADDKIILSVHDNGTGITADQLDKIFIPFFTTKKNGSGIGLALSRQIVLLHNAAIQVRSVPDQETEFQIVL